MYYFISNYYKIGWLKNAYNFHDKINSFKKNEDDWDNIHFIKYYLSNCQDNKNHGEIKVSLKIHKYMENINVIKGPILLDPIRPKYIYGCEKYKITSIKISFSCSIDIKKKLKPFTKVKLSYLKKLFKDSPDIRDCIYKTHILNNNNRLHEWIIDDKSELNRYIEYSIETDNCSLIKYIVDNKLILPQANKWVLLAARLNRLNIYDYLTDHGYISNNKKISEYFTVHDNLEYFMKLRNVSDKCIYIASRHNSVKILQHLLSPLLLCERGKMTYDIYIIILSHGLKISDRLKKILDAKKYKIENCDLEKIIKKGTYDIEVLKSVMSEQNKNYCERMLVSNIQLKLIKTLEL